MEIKTDVRNERGVEVREQLCPAGHVEIDRHSPHSCPWDYYGMRHQRVLCRVLTDAGLHPVPLRTFHRNLGPMGTGPKGRVRFGDDMMPGVYRIGVPESEADASAAAITDHKDAVNRWLFNGEPMPVACQ